MRNRKETDLLFSILIPLATGVLSTLLSGNMSYNPLNKPAFSPPGYIFPVVWTILYILMGVSFYLIYVSAAPGKEKALRIYWIQLIFNFFWSIIFFRLSLYLPAFLWLIILIVLIAVMIYLFYKISPLAAYLQIPYLLWCLFAAYLNFSIYLLNRPA